MAWYLGKLNLSLCFFLLSTTQWRRVGEWRYSSTHSWTSALYGGEWSASRSGRFTPRKRAPGTHWIGGWVGPQSRSGCSGEEKNSQPLPGFEPPDQARGKIYLYLYLRSSVADVFRPILLRNEKCDNCLCKIVCVRYKNMPLKWVQSRLPYQ
jgi:hypothetical protein